MAEFKVVISDPKTGRAYNMNVAAGQAGSFLGKKVGTEIDAASIGMTGYTLKITGGSDRIGIPARGDLPGAGRKKLLLSESIGYHQDADGKRRRKSVRGNEITADFVQINAAVSKYGDKPIESFFEKSASEEQSAEKKTRR